ncbi:Tetratricopeptide repeat-domain-containing protein [Neurospora tetraspora]|uniref:Tetratricopeptide repeat-domain-containing protein n=1 Tax=Neurospora tetraspora TaxID=94610 RepID=A0AAE0JFY4_9PEZI|nr:Tetratricopeptide repeat-domain-containing protein [Neurospora tetraspora]
MANLASTYRNQGRWEEAEKLEVQVMEMSKAKLGADHPDTLTSMANLAFTWNSQGRHEDALALMQDCVEAQQRILGPEHPNTLSSLATVSEWISNLYICILVQLSGVVLNHQQSPACGAEASYL